MPLSISVSIVIGQLIFGPKSTAAAIAIGAAIAISFMQSAWLGMVSGLPIAAGAMLVQHIFVEYTVSRTKMWQDQARDGTPNWLIVLAWCCRIDVVTLMVPAKAIMIFKSAAQPRDTKLSDSSDFGACKPSTSLVL